MATATQTLESLKDEPRIQLPVMERSEVQPPVMERSAGLGICSNQMSDSIRSGRSSQMSDREQIAQVDHDKSAIVSDLLRSLMINEGIQFAQKFLAKKSYL